MRIVRVAATLGVAMALASCAATQKNVGGWFGAATPTPTPKAATATQARRVYYARVEGLEVHSEPSASSKVVGTLSLREKVTRSKVERGYALVESTKSGVKGWVDNAQLTWRLPAAPTAAGSAPVEAQPEEAQPEEAQPEEAPPEEPVAPEGDETQAPAAPEATATATEPLPTTTPVPTARPSAMPTPRGVGPSIFNPY
jgi:uncharacterized protein YgiM (DUF1202 family)